MIHIKSINNQVNEFNLSSKSKVIFPECVIVLCKSRKRVDFAPYAWEMDSFEAPTDNMININYLLLISY